jgi:hypothetical protein
MPRTERLIRRRINYQVLLQGDSYTTGTQQRTRRIQVLSRDMVRMESGPTVICGVMPFSPGLVVRVPGYTTEMYCVSCEVRTEFIYVM